MPTNRPLKVFLCHASADKPAVRKLYQYLRERKMDPWLDAEKLLPGQNWQVEIPKALLSSDVIIICLSKNSVDKEGYVQKEIKFALDKALEMPEGRIFLIPARLEECELPSSLSTYHYVNLFEADGYKRLLRSLRVRAEQIGAAKVSVNQDTIPPKITQPDTPKPKNENTIGVDGNVSGANIIVGNNNIIQVAPKPESEGKIVAPNREVEQTTHKKLEHEKTEHEAPQKMPVEEFIQQNSDQPIMADKQVEQKQLTHKSIPNWLGVLGFIIIIAVILSVIITMNQNPSAPAPTATTSFTVSSIPSETLTPVPTKTITPSPLPTKDLTPESTNVQSQTLGIGSSMISSKDGMKLLYVPAGNFQMGSVNGHYDEEPVHSVYLNTFWIDQTDVTNAMYSKCVAAKICTPPYRFISFSRSSYYGDSQFENYPVIFVDWNMAGTYCNWAGRQLPTEAQWEKAARGTDERSYPWGNDSPNSSLLNYMSIVGDTTEVSKYPRGASFYGALDMAGNVWQWVADWHSGNYYQSSPTSNPTGPSFGDYRVLRGGSWSMYEYDVRSTYRNQWFGSEGANYFFISFRCAQSATP